MGLYWATGYAGHASFIEPKQFNLLRLCNSLHLSAKSYRKKNLHQIYFMYYFIFIHELNKLVSIWILKYEIIFKYKS